MEQITKKTIGQRINEALAIRDVKQKDLAKFLEVTDNTISYFVSGKRTPNTEQIIEIAKFLDVSADYLLGLSTNMTTDAELQAVCEYTGLSEENCLKLKKLKDTANGLYDCENKMLQEIKIEADEFQKEYEELRNLYPKEALEFDEYMSMKPNERNEEIKERLEENGIYHELLIAYSNACFETENAEIKKQEIYKTYNAKIESLNKLLSNDKVEEFLIDLFLFVNINQGYDTNITSVITNIKDTNDSMPFTFSTNLISSALLQKIQNYIQSLKGDNPCYILCETEACIDEKMQIAKDILYHKKVESGE